MDPSNVYLASIDFPFDTPVFVARKRDSKRKGMHRGGRKQEIVRHGTEGQEKGKKTPLGFSFLTVRARHRPCSSTRLQQRTFRSTARPDILGRVEARIQRRIIAPEECG